MALSRIQGVEELYVGGIWALRRSDSLLERNITHVLSLVSFNPSNFKNFKNEPFTEYGKRFKHLLIDIDDVEDSDLLIELPKAVKFIDQGLRGSASSSSSNSNNNTTNTKLEEAIDGISIDDSTPKRGGVFVHCAAGKSRSVSVIVAYLLWRYPNRFDPSATPSASAAAAGVPQPSRRETALDAVIAAVRLIRQTRPMAEPNDGFMEQLALWWEMGCPANEDMESQPIYQRWAYKREVQQDLEIGQAPTRLRFEDEALAQQQQQQKQAPASSSGPNLRCKKCRLTLATAPFILPHKPPSPLDTNTYDNNNNNNSPSGTPAAAAAAAAAASCQHHFIEALGWMRSELEKGALSGRLTCPNAKCGAGVGRYDWKGFRCSCGGWETPAFSLQKARVDEEVKRIVPTVAAGGGGGATAAMRNMGIRMPPGGRGGNL